MDKRQYSKYTLEYVKNYFKERGCECLADKYISVKEPMPYICECKNQAMITFDCFKRDRRCRKCGLSCNAYFTYHNSIKDDKKYQEQYIHKFLLPPEAKILAVMQHGYVHYELCGQEKVEKFALPQIKKRVLDQIRMRYKGIDHAIKCNETYVYAESKHITWTIHEKPQMSYARD